MEDQNINNQDLENDENKQNQLNQNNITPIKGKEIQNINETNKKNEIKNINKIEQTSKDIDNFQNSLAGFPNIGHSCYMNSFLQILFRTNSFLYELKKYKSERKNQDLINYLIYLSENPDNVFIIKKIKEIMSEEDESFGMYTQNDSQEFGIGLINKIISILKIEPDFNDDDEIEETNKGKIEIIDIKKHKLQLFNEYIDKYYNKKNEIFLEKMFQFHESKVKYEEESKECLIKSIDFETFLNLELTFPPHINKTYNLYDLLNYKYPTNFEDIQNRHNNVSKNNDPSYNFSIPFTNYNISIYYSPKKNKDINLSNNNNVFCIRKIASLPNILIISINRAIAGKKLITNALKYEEEINLINYIDEIVDNKNMTYKLYGVNECFGVSKSLGHYYSYVKINNSWYKFNDKEVSTEEPNLESKYVVGLYYIREISNNNLNL